MTATTPIRRPALAGCALVFALILPACGDDDGGPNDCPAHLLPGDLVITEVMPNPLGADDGKEWFEVYNATTAAIDLTGVTLVYSRADGSNRKTHLVAAGSIAPGEYQVFGGVLEVARPAWVDYGFADDLGSFTNSGGRLALECGNTTVDAAVYLEADDGVSLGYNGNLVPDAVANDTLTEWCDQTSTYEADSYGTPGAPNDPCGPVVPPGTCLDGGVSRNVVAPTVGNVIITELMADPSSTDGDKEWVELYFTQAADLNGLVLSETPGTEEHTVSDATCLPVAAGSYVLVASSADTALNGGLPHVDVVWPNLSLTNTGDSITVSYGGTVLDAVTFTDPMVDAGKATALDPAHLDAAENDDATSWCDATAAYGAGDLGTPGAPNASCGGGPTDTCLDGGTPRSVVAPAPGTVIINELMADPAAVGDTAGEWVELYFTQGADLNGLELGEVPGTVMHTVSDANCLPVAAGTYVLVARTADSLQNGGLPPVDVIWPNLGLSNTGGSLFVGVGGAVLDQVSYTDPMVDPGSSTALDPAHQNVTDNDNTANWCDGTSTYGSGDRGTPGAANASCGGGGNTCLDGGTPRAIVPPVAGEVVINEVMANPTGTDTDREWFEVWFANAADLNGLELGASAPTVAFTVSGADCIHVTAGTYAILARSSDSLVNGGLPAVTATYSGITLVQGGGALFVGHGGAVLDTVAYPAATDGVSSSLSLPARDPAQNDVAANWCVSTSATPPATSYGAGGTGTPGAANPTCN